MPRISHRRAYIVFAIVLLACSWFYLESWYEFRRPGHYIIASIAFIVAVFLLLFKPLRKLIRGHAGRMFLSLAMLLLLLPWSEWLRLNLQMFRDDWSRQILHQTVFLSIIFSSIRIFPSAADRIHTATLECLAKLQTQKAILWFPAGIFFLLSTYIALFVMHRNPIVTDSAAYLFQAKIFSSLKLYAPAPPFSEFFNVVGDQLVIHNGKWFSMYPPGYPLLLALGIPFHAAWLISPLLGALTLCVWIRYAARFHGMTTALVFGWIAALSPFLFNMFASLMVHSAELLAASLVIYLIRNQTENPSKGKPYGLAAILILGMLVRPFSFLVFLAPVLGYFLYAFMRQKSYFPVLCVLLAVFIGCLMLAFYQWKTTGSPLMSGYILEDQTHKLGFGPSFSGMQHSPTRALENTSNRLLGLNKWLTGWYSGSIFFLIYFLLTAKKNKWDFILALCCIGLFLFYFFYVVQDLIIGPRFVFLTAPIALLFLARIVTESTGKDNLVPVMLIISFLVYIPFGLPHFINTFRVQDSKIRQLATTKALVFLGGRNILETSLNDPFLRDPVILCKNLGDKNRDIETRFPDHRPLYFQAKVKSDRFSPSLEYELSSEPPGPSTFSFYRFSALLSRSVYDSDRDLIDAFYGDESFRFAHANQQLEQVMAHFSAAPENPNRKKFRLGLSHLAAAVLLTQTAFEERPDIWPRNVDAQEFEDEFRRASSLFHECEDLSKSATAAMDKVEKRIDRNDDRHFSQFELQIFLAAKKTDLQFGLK